MFNGYDMFLRVEYFFNSKLVDNFWICSSVQTINSATFSRLSRYSLSSVRAPSESKNKWGVISLNYFTGHIKKVIYVFHINGNSFDMIFITAIQLKIHKGNGFLRIYFHRVFILICFSLQKSFFRGHNL